MWRPVLAVNGFIVLVLGIMMLIPAVALDYYTGTPDDVFIKSGIVAIFFGGAVFLANFGKVERISILQGYLITVSSWFITPLVCALPFYLSQSIGSWHDAVFEAAAGITTTGSTVLSNIPAQPKSLLLWRSMLNGLGGIGIIIFAVALSPFLGTGGMYLFSKENSDTEEKFMPKISYIAKDIIIVYIILNALCMLLLKHLGMNWFEAITWGLSTVSTGGSVVKPIAAYDNMAIEAVVALFMLLGALPITYFILFMKKRNFKTLANNPQVNTFIKLIIIYTAVLTLLYAYQKNVSLTEGFRVAGFNLIATITTAGIYSSDFTAWGSWAVIVFLILFFHGGCTGSTTGSIKIFRWQVVAAFLKQHMIKSLSPNQVVVMKTGDKVIDGRISSSVFALISSFIGAALFFTLILSLLGIDFVTALGAVSGCITGVGSGLTEALGPNGNFAEFSPMIKYVLSFVMVLGRLEVITVFVLLSKIRL